MKWPLLFWFVLATPLASRADDTLGQLLAHVPDDAALVVVTPNLDKLVAGIADFGRSIDVASLRDLSTPKLLSELELLEKTVGLDSGGPFLLAWSPGRFSPLLLCTAHDADAWCATAGAQSAGADVWRVLMFGEPAYIAAAGPLLIIGDELDAVRAALRSGSDFAARFGPRGKEWLADNQLVLSVRVPEWTGMIAPALSAARASLQITMMIAGQQDENALRLVNWFFERTEALVGQVENYTAAVRVGAEGVSGRDGLTFQPDGPAAAYLKKVTNSDRNLLRGLLEDDALFVFACEWELQPKAQTLSGMLVEAFFGAGPLRQRLGEEKFQTAYQALLSVQDEISGYSTAITAGPPGEPLLFSGFQYSAQPKLILERTRQSYEIDPEFIGAFGGGTNIELSFRTERLDSNDVYVYQLDFTTADEQARRMLEALYGRTITTCSAAHPLGVAYATGPAERAHAQLARMLSGQGRTLDENPRVQEARRRLAPNPQVLMLLDLSRGLELVIRIAKLTGAPLPPAEFPQKPMPLVAYGGYLDGNTLRGELFVPAEPVKAAVSAIQSVKRRSTSGPTQKP